MPSIDFRQNENLIKEIAKNDGREVFEYNEALGQIDFESKVPKNQIALLENGLLEFLKEKDDQARLASANSEPKPMFLVLKNADDELENPKIIAMLDRIASANIYDDDYYVSLFLLSTKRIIPAKLEHHITIFETPVPKEKEIKAIIQKFADDYGITIKDEFFDKLTLNLKGLTKFEIDRILTLAYQQNGEINGDDNEFIISQKSQFVKKSGMLEIIEVKETMANLGGLSVLKKWLKDKAHIIRNLDKAHKYGVDIPKGVMIVGMPPEFLSKGRFDEIFFVDLPNFTERKEILKLHLEHRSKTKNSRY
ncbi:hypothetical protein [Campylobacter hyointestinalis]|uniref:hypothetical protein n=1 Tax=Campylobacter hyointestinalis TaxID=198 RepID=UPI000DCCA601|nr:hypothetical protein [Campylobacter hyointestinalis]RAZ46665.1 hypothetical protein CHL14416_03780 [Campylobacter hyointestinalis subsp. lawsonii]